MVRFRDYEWPASNLLITITEEGRVFQRKQGSKADVAREMHPPYAPIILEFYDQAFEDFGLVNPMTMATKSKKKNKGTAGLKRTAERDSIDKESKQQKTESVGVPPRTVDAPHEDPSTPETPVPPSSRRMSLELQEEEEQVDLPSTSNSVIILIRSSSGSPIFTSPQQTSNALLNSCFGKYYIEDTCTVLGDGASMKIEVTSLKKIPPLDSINILGQWQVRCWQPGPDKEIYSFGKFSPIDPEISEEDIRKSLKNRDQPTSRLIAVERLYKYSPTKQPSYTVRLQYEGTLPTQISVGIQTYKVYRYDFKVLQCYRCLRFGHGTLTCRSPPRCSFCSGNHITDNCQTKDNLKCIFCKGDHRSNSKSCPAYQEATKISQQTKSPDGPLDEKVNRTNLRKFSSNVIAKGIPSLSSPPNWNFERTAWGIKGTTASQLPPQPMNSNEFPALPSTSTGLPKIFPNAWNRNLDKLKNPHNDQASLKNIKAKKRWDSLPNVDKVSTPSDPPFNDSPRAPLQSSNPAYHNKCASTDGPSLNWSLFFLKAAPIIMHLISKFDSKSPAVPQINEAFLSIFPLILECLN